MFSITHNWLKQTSVVLAISLLTTGCADRRPDRLEKASACPLNSYHYSGLLLNVANFANVYCLFEKINIYLRMLNIN